jgi:signal transduction histidine kinase
VGDPRRLQQVFWNIIKNSSKFSPVEGSIRLRTRNEHPEWIAVEVTDSGIGIDPDYLPKIFNAFEQTAGSITRQYGGVGLGLAITKAIVEAHGGTITASSDGAGKGAAFTVRLPLTEIK